MPAIQRVSLQSEIIKYIQDYIRQHNLQDGDKLPSQTQLVGMMGVSRTSLREAIKTLEAKGILEVQNGKGIYVRDGAQQGLLNQLAFTREKESLLELIEARRILEREIIRLTVKNATDEELARLGEVLAVVLRKYRRGEVQNVEEHQFHYMIYEFSHNRVMCQIIQSISAMLDTLWNFPLDLEFDDTIPLHEDLYRAIRARDAHAAQRINEQILDMVVHDVERQI